MGCIRVPFCCHCGKQTDALTRYWQWDHFSSRTSEAIKDQDKLDLCSGCLELAKKNFRDMKKFEKPPLDGV